jgi:hypothetical protein
MSAGRELVGRPAPSPERAVTEISVSKKAEDLKAVPAASLRGGSVARRGGELGARRCWEGRLGAGLIKFLGDVKLSLSRLPLLARSAGQQRLLRPKNPNRPAGHPEVASIRALWLEAAVAARQPCRLRTRNGESARAEETEVDKKTAKRTQSRRRNPGESAGGEERMTLWQATISAQRR